MNAKRAVLSLVPIAACLVALAPPAQARAADRVLAHDTQIRVVYALDDDLVYYRRGKTLPERVWMRRVGGKLRRATAIPRRALPGAIGRDAKGRKVLTFQLYRIEGGTLVSAKWFVYDLASDRA